MSTRNDLQEQQNRLADRGVLDVKFFIAPGDPQFSKLSSDATDVLDAINEGRFTEMPPFGDEKKAANS